MEKLSENKDSFVNRVITPNAEDERQALNYFAEIFKKQPEYNWEKDKNPALQKFIEDVNQKLGEFVKEYGGNPIAVPPKNIHMIDIDKLELTEQERAKKVGWSAQFLPEQQSFIAFEKESRLAFASTLVHEMIHANSFISYVPSEHPKLDYQRRRLGLDMYRKPQEQAFFHKLTEAVTTELTKSFCEKYFPKLEFTKEEWGKLLSIRNEFRAENPEIADDLLVCKTEQEPNGQWKTTLETYTYVEERERFRDLVDEMYKKSKPGQFSSKEEVFKLFTQAMLNGRLLTLARTIEEALGKESFRRLGEKTKG